MQPEPGGAGFVATHHFLGLGLLLDDPLQEAGRRHLLRRLRLGVVHHPDDAEIGCVNVQRQLDLAAEGWLWGRLWACSFARPGDHSGVGLGSEYWERCFHERSDLEATPAGCHLSCHLPVHGKTGNF